MADTLADLEHRPGRLGWAAGPGELQRPVCGGCAAAGRGTGGAVMGTSRTVIMWTGLWLSHLCRLVTAGHRLLSSCPLPPPATTAYLSRSPPHCCCVTCNWSAQSPSPPFHAPAAELENICAAMTSLFQPLHGGRGGAAAVVTFKPWSREQDTLGLGLGTVATPELTVAVAATHNPLMLSPTSTDNTHQPTPNYKIGLKTLLSLLSIHGRGVAPVQFTVAS